MKTVPTKKPRISIVIDEALQQRLERLAESEDRSVSNLALKLIKGALEHPKRDSSSSLADEAETLDLLIGFLNYLIDHFDHDGYSLSEISKILGRPDDKDLVALVQKLQQNGQAHAKPGAKVK